MWPHEAAASARRAIQDIRVRARAAGAARLLADLRSLGVNATLTALTPGEVVNDFLRANRAAQGVEKTWAGATQETQTAAKAAQESTLRRTAVTEASEAFNRRAEVVSVPKEDADQLELVWDSQLEACPRCRGRDGERTRYGTPFRGSQPGGMHPRCLCSWHVERRAAVAPQEPPAPRPTLRLVKPEPPTPEATPAPAKVKNVTVPRGLPPQAAKDFRLLLRGASESALDFGRDGYRPKLSIYGPGLSRRQINDIATGRVVPPGSKWKLPPIDIGLRGDLHSGKTIQLVDGRHRLEAAQAAGATQMRANITVYGPRGGIKWQGERIIRTPKPDVTNLHER